ncbi:hypothetical protein Aple_007200 [Acrocarpospora pleiomorpha]|uniref:Uncharacterized protein n=1 Tax=Acrocarpospora pleiomorpha TaxID=90975 RepID=A0A5M3X827_9ACTN|nr:hypothetical protein Aple_007200 [Acrocarpospora pleiomorpha]
MISDTQYPRPGQPEPLPEQQGPPHHRVRRGRHVIERVPPPRRLGDQLPDSGHRIPIYVHKVRHRVRNIGFSASVVVFSLISWDSDAFAAMLKGEFAEQRLDGPPRRGGLPDQIGE